MSILAWVAVLAAVWFAASIATALLVGRYLRRSTQGVATDDDAFRPLDTGPRGLWLRDLDIPRPRRTVEPVGPDVPEAAGRA